MNIIPLKTRRSSTRGLPWLLGKKGLRRSICASDSQKRLLIDQVSSRSLNHVITVKSMGPDPKQWVDAKTCQPEARHRHRSTSLDARNPSEVLPPSCGSE